MIWLPVDFSIIIDVTFRLVPGGRRRKEDIMMNVKHQICGKYEFPCENNEAPPPPRPFESHTTSNITHTNPRHLFVDSNR